MAVQVVVLDVAALFMTDLPGRVELHCLTLAALASLVVDLRPDRISPFLKITVQSINHWHSQKNF